MTSSSERGGSRLFPNVPPPQGVRPAQNYARFIPGEELGSYERWQPGTFGSGVVQERRLHARAVEQPEFSNEEWRGQVRAALEQGLAQGREAGLREGRQAGYEAGYRDGMAALEGFKTSFTEQMSARIGQLVASLDEQLAALEPQMAEAVAGTAVLLARQVLREALRTHPEHVSQVAREAVNAIVMSARQIVVHVHPDDLPLVAQGAQEALQARGARLQADATLQRGGCRVSSDAGSVDASLESRWAHACAALGPQVPLQEGTAAASMSAPPSTPSSTPSVAGEGP